MYAGNFRVAFGARDVFGAAKYMRKVFTESNQRKSSK